jgi:hypothetical protein
MARSNTPAAVVRGELMIRWKENPEDQREPLIHSITATNLTLVTSTNPPVFHKALERVVTEDPREVFIDPVMLYDIALDGAPDIFLGAKNLWIRNLGGGRFQPGQISSGLSNQTVRCSVIADFNNDQLPDFLFVHPNGVAVLPGTREGKFSTSKIELWRSPEQLLNPFCVTAGDADGDGFADLWLGQYKVPYNEGQMPTPYWDANDGFPAYFLKNMGGKFVDQTQDSGLAAKRFRRAYSGSFVDLDNDADLDLVVVSDFAGVDLFINNGSGKFTDSTSKLLQTPSAFGMAHNFSDFDGNGLLDFLIIGMNSSVAERLHRMRAGPPNLPDHQKYRPLMGYGNRLYLGTPDGFQENTPLARSIAESGWSWGVASLDFNNDGWNDVYIANGHKSRESARDYEGQFWRHDIYAGTSEHDPAVDQFFRSTATRLYGTGYSYGGYEKNRLYLNLQGKEFMEVGYLAGVSLELDTRNVVSTDLDQDGKLDLIVTSYEVWPQDRQTFFIYRNDMATNGNWISVALDPSGGNPVLGAKVVLRAGGREHLWQYVTGDSYRSQFAPRAHFGLGSVGQVDELLVRWPNKKETRLSKPAVNQLHLVK